MRSQPWPLRRSPGSTLYFVWYRAGAMPFGDFEFGRDANAIFRQRPDNIFVVKASYWIGR